MTTATTLPLAAAAAACSILAPVASFVVPSAPSPNRRSRSPALRLLYQDEGVVPGGSPLMNATRINGDALDHVGIVTNDEADFVGAGTLGDIMAGAGGKSDATENADATATVKDGLVTKDGGGLNARFSGCDFTPMERIALTANGNLQRIFSSYYDAPVHVHVDSCSRRKPPSANGGGVPSANNPRIWFDNNDIDFDSTTRGMHVVNGDAIWDRVVSIQVHDRTICRATSIIGVRDPLCVRLIDNGSVGLGQMFRYLNKLPTFSLLDAGRIEAPTEFRGGMWRTYELDCDEMTCLIHEEFLCEAWDVEPKQD